MAKLGIQGLDDIAKLERTLKLFAVRLPEAGDKSLERTSHKVANQSRGKLSSRAGSRGKYKRMPEDMGQESKGKFHGIELQRGGTMIAAEYGATFHVVFGKRVTAKSMKRRVFGARVKRLTSGKIVGKTVKADLPRAEKDLALTFDKRAEADFRKAGL